MTYDEYLDMEGHVSDEDGTQALLRRLEWDPEARDEMDRDDAAGRS